jgi:hypothetical protein
MKTSLRTLTLVVLLSALPALAAGPVVLEFDCHTKSMPRLQAFARDAGLADAGQAAAERRTVRHQLVRACQRGADRVHLVRIDGAGDEGRWLVQR